jgi:hypothetical protein
MPVNKKELQRRRALSKPAIRWRTLKERVEKDYFLHNHGNNPALRTEAAWEEHKKNKYRKTVLPQNEFYEQDIQPRLEAIEDLNEIERMGELAISGLERIANTPEKDTPGKRVVARQFINQLFDDLSEEKDDVILATAALQGALVDTEGSRYVLDRFELQELYKHFRGTEFEPFMADFIEVGASIQTPTKTKKYLTALPTILQTFTETESMELIPTFIKLAKEARDPDDLAEFDYSSPSAVHSLARLRRAGDHFPQVFRLYQAMLHRAKNNWLKSMEKMTGERIVENVFSLEEKGYGNRIDTFLEQAIVLTERGVDGASFFTCLQTHLRHAGEHFRSYLQYTYDLAGMSPEAADSFLHQWGKPFQLPQAQRERYLEVGLRIAEEFGSRGKAYFGSALRVMQNNPDIFEHWRAAVSYFGRHDQVNMGTFMSNTAATSNEGIDEMLDAAMWLHTAMQVTFTEDSEQARALQNQATLFDPFSALWNVAELSPHTTTKKPPLTVEIRGVPLDVIPKKPPVIVDIRGYVLDVFRFFKRKQVHNIKPMPGMVYRGYDYDKTIEILSELADNNLLVSDLPDMTAVINADIHPAKKIDLINEYALVWNILDSNTPSLDLEGAWRESARELLIEKVKKGVATPVDKLSTSDLMKVASITQTNRKEPRLDMIIEATVKDGVPKSYPKDTVYASVIVDGLTDRLEPVAMTEQLVYALISRDPEKQAAAAEHFDPQKIADARGHINARKLHTKIAEHIPSLILGSRTAAEAVLEVISASYGSKEAIGDLVDGVRGLLLEDYRFDSLEVRSMKGVVSDLFDSRRTMCCAFLPRSVREGHAFNYVLDEDFVLLHLIPRIGRDVGEPIGVVVGYLAQELSSGERYFMVDGVEAGAGVDRLKGSVWMPLVYEGIMNFSADAGVENVLFNVEDLYNTKPQQFVNFVRRHHSSEIVTRTLDRTTRPGCLLDSITKKEWENYTASDPDAQPSIDEFSIFGSSWENGPLQALAQRYEFYLEAANHLEIAVLTTDAGPALKMTYHPSGLLCPVPQRE